MTEAFKILPPEQQELFNFKETYGFRHLYVILVWRTLRVRYKQTVIGVGWALLQPLLMTFVFSVIFGRFANMPSDGQPYPLFVMSGLMVWQFIAQSFTTSSVSIVLNTHLVTKIYFPRIILSFAAVTAALVDFLCALAILFCMMLWYRIPPTAGLLLFVPVFCLGVLTVLGLSLWLSALYVKYRDIGHLLPFLTQIWMFLCPVIYPSSLLPAKYQLLYALNPIVVVIDATRWALAGGPPPQARMLGVSAVVAIMLFGSGLWYFRRKEATFADIV